MPAITSFYLPKKKRMENLIKQMPLMHHFQNRKGGGETKLVMEAEVRSAEHGTHSRYLWLGAWEGEQEPLDTVCTVSPGALGSGTESCHS